MAKPYDYQYETAEAIRLSLLTSHSRGHITKQLIPYFLDEEDGMQKYPCFRGYGCKEDIHFPSTRPRWQPPGRLLLAYRC